MRKVQLANALIRTDCGGRCMLLIEKKNLPFISRRRPSIKG